MQTGVMICTIFKSFIFGFSCIASYVAKIVARTLSFVLLNAIDQSIHDLDLDIRM